MNKNNFPPKQLAELLARKCSDSINEALPDLYSQGDYSKEILQSIPLVELLEFYNDYKTQSICSDCACPSCARSKSLNHKLTQILEGETKK